MDFIQIDKLINLYLLIFFKMIKTGIKVADAMTSNPVCVEPEETISNCVKKMIKHNVGSLVVMEGEKLVGIITEKDLLTKVLAKNLDVKKTPVSKVMTKKPIHVDPDLDLYDAMNLMKKEEIRRLPVVDKGVFVGLLTNKDILSIQPDLYDLFIDSFKIRESERKSMLKGTIEGKCQSCGSYGPLEKIRGKWLCDSCKE